MPAINDQGGVTEHQMYRPPQNEESQVRLEDILARLRASMPQIPGIGGGGSSLLILVVLGVIAVLWAATGFYTVGPNEQAALRTFGKYTALADQGLHWHWPSPVGTRNVVAITTTRRMELGFRGPESNAGSQDVPTESLMITGDENIVDVEAVIQYRISSLPDFLFEVDDPGDPDRDIPSGRPDGRTLRDIAETAIRQVVGARLIDDVLTAEREQVQTEVLLAMRELANEYRTGIEVQQVLLQNVTPPAEVQSAFEDVVRAREDRERLINLAEAYRADRLPRASGDAAVIVEAAEGFRQGRIVRSQGEAEGFSAILEGYATSPDVTRRRLYLEAMEEILPGITKYIMSEQGVLPFLPLEGQQQMPQPTGGAQ
ncbi:MAG: FtsH protease activity modulator HflK [Dehalococcoidia bacterium]